MAKVIIPEYLEREIDRKFKGEAVDIFELMFSLRDFPKKGKLVGRVGNVAIKELKYKSFRFYFIVDAYRVKFFGVDELHDLLIKFLRMSDKKSQEKVIEEVRDFLRRV